MSCCDGRCCATFTYPSTPKQLRENPNRTYPSSRDALYIADMLIPLTTEEARERRKKFGIKVGDPEGQQYTCKHWDEDTKLCTAYEERPLMCKEYPYERKCDHGCGFENDLDLVAMLKHRAITQGWKDQHITLGEN